MPTSNCVKDNLHIQSSSEKEGAHPTGRLIINADDWGCDRDTTSRTLECIQCGTVSSVSAMVFMRDSERAAGIALEQGIDCGLHLNFTTPFTVDKCSSRLRTHQDRIRRYLRRNRLAQTIYHPGLNSSFKYVVSTQIDEFERVYGKLPQRIDGHHHMHLCANVVFGGLLPKDAQIRRNFSFWPGEKSGVNRLYRRFIDRKLARHHQLTDYFFTLLPLEPVGRVKEIASLARQAVVEVETHPLNSVEYEFLSSGEILRCIGHLQIARGFSCST